MERVIGTEDDIFFTVNTVKRNEDTEPFTKIKSHLNDVLETVATDYD